jgi:glycosyltransferase involved in cell wall biosynthesis
MEKKCLIIGYYFYPDSRVGAKRYNLLSNYLSKKIKTLCILTIKETYVPEKDESFVHGGKIFRTGMFPRRQYGGNKLINVLNKILLRIIPIDYHSGWIIPLVFNGIRIIKKNDINTVIVTGPPFSPFVAAYLLSILFKLDLIIDYQDPWFFDDDNGGNKFNWFLEKLILKKAQKIIFNTHRTKEEYLKQKLKFNILEKSFVINNPYLSTTNVDPLYLEKDKKVILYAGNFYGKRRLKYIFEPLVKLFTKDELKDKISIHVFGEIHNEDAALIKKLDLSDIIFEHERIEYYKLTRYMKGADILYLSQGEDHGYSVPYKLIDYITIGRPILAVTSLYSSTYNFMLGLDCGIAADIDDPNSIFEALKELLVDEKKFSYNGIEKYSLNNLGEQYYKIIFDSN